MSLIAHYKLDGNVNDYSGYGRHGINHGALVNEDGKIGKCYKLDGLGYISLPVSLSASDVGTISMWYNAESAYNYNTLWDTSLNADQWECWIYANETIATRIRWAISTVKFPIGSWTHLTFTWDRAGSQRLYLDGELKSETAVNGWALSGNEVNIGGKLNTKGKGLVNDVRIYDHALSEREVRDLSQGLVLHYTFDQFQEPTENKVTSHIPGWVVWDGFTGTSVTFSEGNISGIKLTGTASGGVKWRASNYIQALPSTTYTVSAIMKWLGTYPSPNFFYLRQYNSAGAQVEERGVVLATGLSSGQWHPVSETFTTRSDCASFIIEGYQYIAPCEIWCGNLQVEQKSYASPFVNGTRAGVVRDQSTQGNDAPLVLANTPKWVEGGMVGKGCYEFAGDGKTPGILSPQIKTDKYTISFWAKHTSAGKMAFGSDRSGAFYWFGDYSWKYMHGGTSGEFYYPKSQTINIGEWGHFAVTYDGSNVRIYRNGVCEGAKASSGIPNFDRHSIGYGYDDPSYDFQGQIDDVRIYTTALTPEEIRELYQQRASLDSHGNFYSSLISSNVGYQKVWGDGSGVGFTIYGIDGSSVSTNGVLRFTTINTDPMINMYNIGSFDPNVYKFIQVKYRVVSGNAGSVEIFFTNTQYTTANEAQVGRAPLNSDGNWNVVTVAMHTHPNWTNSNITGWRFDMGIASGVTIEVEWIRLVSDTGALSVKSNKVVGNFSEVGITNGLVAYYPLNKDAKDYSGNGYHGTVTDAVLTGGGFDGKGAYSFDNTGNQFINLVDENFAGFSDFSMSVWVNPKGNHKNYDGAIVSSGNWDRAHWAFSVLQNNSGIRTRDPAITVNHTIPLNAWTQIAWVRQGTLLSVYVDGVLRGSATNTANIPLSSDYSNTRIGGDTYGYPTYFAFNGEICNVKVFNRALTPEEIAVEYKRTGVSKMTQHNGTVYIQGQVKETI